MKLPAVLAAAQETAGHRCGPVLPLWARCAPGLEAEAAAELAALGWIRPPGDDTAGLMTGRATVYGVADLATIYRSLWCARSVESIAWLLATAEVHTLEEITDVMGDLDLSRLAPGPFAVRAERHGTHPFQSPDIARVAGQRVIDTVLRQTTQRLPVDLDDPANEVRVELDGVRLRVGFALNDEPLHRRAWRTHGHPAGLRPTTAAALLTLSGWRADERLVDPMAGGATIPIEAALAGRRRAPRALIPPPRLTALGIADAACADACGRQVGAAELAARSLDILAVERFATHVALAEANRAQADLAHAIEVRHGDATRLEGVGPFDVVVCNPPFGKRAGSPRILGRLYREALVRLSDRLAPHGRIVWLTTATAVLHEAADAADLEIRQAHAVMLGDLAATAFLLTPR